MTKVYFEYTTTSGDVHRVTYNNKKEREKAWRKMFKFYNNDDRMHPLWEFIDEDDEKMQQMYLKAQNGSLFHIRKCLNYMWEYSGLEGSFYGRKVVK